MGVLGAKGGNLMKSYWAMILAARYANKNTSHALSVHLVLPEREFWDATHIAWREIGSLRISFFFFFFFHLQSLSTRGAVRRQYELPTDQAHNCYSGWDFQGGLRELQLDPGK